MRSSPLRFFGGTVAGVLGLATISGCGDSGGTASAPAVVRDSAGITIVENSSPEWADNEGWRLSGEPVTVIGAADGPPEYQFHNVMGLLVQTDGTIVVGDMGSSQLRFFDPEGKHLRTVSRNGSGPGEIGQLIRLTGFRGDTLMVVDGYGPLHVFDASGGYVTSHRPSTGRSFYQIPVGYTNDGRIVFILQGDFPQQITEPVQPEYTPVLSRLSEATVDTITTLLSQTFYPGWRGLVGEMLFGPRRHLGVVSDGLVTGNSAQFELIHYDFDGNVTRIVRRAWEPQPVTDDMTDRYGEAYVATPGESGNPVPESLQRQRREIHEATQVATSLPAFTRLLVDSDDNLWVRETDPEHLVLPQEGWNTFEPIPSRWNIFDPEGTWLGAVETPANFIIKDIGSDYVAGLTRDDLGVEMIHVYALNK